ncbi:glycosyltransferase [Candidatus Gottesmanbacteria bacterium]|nr:glycosyltransferase [Candidatus Gottesmanbacteria bacterium]
MNIAFISYWSCPLTRLGVLSSGGMNVYVLNLANNLGTLGHTVDIYTHSHHENDEKILQIHKNVRIIHFSVHTIDHYQGVESFANKMLDFMGKNSLQYDLLHSHYFYSSLVGQIIKKSLHIPLFTTFHALGITKELYGGISDKLRIQSEKNIVNFSDGIISSVELEKKELVDKYKADAQKIFVVAPGVNHHVFKKIDRKKARMKIGITSDEKIILFVGRIDPIKGISILINAVSKLSKKFTDFKDNFKVLLIGGDIESRTFWRNPEVIKIQTLIERLDLACCIKFIGNRPHNVLPYYYSASDIVIMPSRYESFGLVVLEAMASGTAVIASKVGGLSYLIKDKVSGRFFRSGDVENLGEVIWELLNDDKQRDNLGKKAIIESQKYCWDLQAEKIIGFYKKYL